MSAWKNTSKGFAFASWLWHRHWSLENRMSEIRRQVPVVDRHCTSYSCRLIFTSQSYFSSSKRQTMSYISFTLRSRSAVQLDITRAKITVSRHLWFNYWHNRYVKRLSNRAIKEENYRTWKKNQKIAQHNERDTWREQRCLERRFMVGFLSSCCPAWVLHVVEVIWRSSVGWNRSDTAWQGLVYGICVVTGRT